MTGHPPILAVLLCLFGVAATAQYVPLQRLPGDAGFTATMAFGTPGQKLELLVDTGSSDTAVAGAGCCGASVAPTFDPKSSSSAVNTSVPIEAHYTANVNSSWHGFVFRDDALLGSATKVVKSTPFAVITGEKNYFPGSPTSPKEGVLGLAYAGKAHANMQPFMDTYTAAGNPDRFALELCPDEGGSGKESALYLGDFNTTSLPSTPFRSVRLVTRSWYVVNVTALHVGATKLAVKSTEYTRGDAIIDTGTPSLSLPAAVRTVFVEALKSVVRQTFPASFWAGSSCAAVDGLADSWPTISLTLSQPAAPAGMRGASDAVVVSVAPEQYLVKTSTSGSDRCLAVNSITGKGVVLGAGILRGYVVLFERGQGTVSFAPSRRCGSGVPVPAPTLGPVKPSRDPSAGDQDLKIAGIVLGGLMLVGIAGGVTYWFRRHSQQLAEAEAADFETCPRDPLLDQEDANEGGGRRYRAKRFSTALL